ncbi:peptide deformylase [Candidatus Acetothermia bacterium]|nr:peptide deformylase [Candidatus Acetothermia bacterium]MBI3460156.1 peptide deformylase [Candidatus Acetothermia bacterium]MBI3659969.1 peptide deformylase [Candidatus Acetothermia bacterium]
MALKIRKYPDPILRRRAQEIKSIDAEIKKLADELVEAMVLAKGYGLAAPQVGVLKRMITTDVNDNLYVLINPEIVERGDENVEGLEGCLSIPRAEAEIIRPARVKVRALTPEGKEIALDDNGLLARVLQHEIDHLNGVLFIDYLNEAKRLSLLKEYERSQREGKTSKKAKATAAL